MNIEQSYGDSLQECREMIAALILSTEQWVQRHPEIERLLKLQNRAGQRLGRIGPDIKQAKRARLLYDRRCSRFARIWKEKEAFDQEAKTQFDHLSTVLIRDEVERMKAGVNWADPDSILKALQQAAQTLEEFWQSHNGQSAAPAAGAESESRRKNDSTPVIKKRPEYRRQDEDAVRDLVRRLHAEGCSQLEMCERLGNMPRPPMAKWRNLTWLAAFRDPMYRDSVKTKLSKLAHAEIPEFPR